MKRIVALLIFALALVANPSIGRALDWYVVLNFSIADPSAPGGAIQSHLILGVDPNANDGFNNQWDTVAFPAGPLQVSFPHPEYLNSANYVAGSELLWRDIRGDSQAQHIWNIDSASDRFGTNTTVSWTFTAAANQCQHPILTLTDETQGTHIDMNGNGSYTFPNGASPTRLVIDFTQGTAALPPPPPSNLWSPRQGKDSILLSWSGKNDSNFLGYTLFRRAPNQTNYAQINVQPITMTSYLDTHLTPGETYLYKVTAVNTDGCSSVDSNEISVVLN